jgi:hypothetical protein
MLSVEGASRARSCAEAVAATSATKNQRIAAPSFEDRRASKRAGRFKSKSDILLETNMHLRQCQSRPRFHPAASPSMAAADETSTFLPK